MMILWLWDFMKYQCRKPFQNLVAFIFQDLNLKKATYNNTHYILNHDCAILPALEVGK